ncbi:MAG: T9SS type A sorting domain-containing protein [Chlorobi bacterium]|nr:T9SS type A sorting domain-containing protein [Chlorobiota bacterium]
MKRLLLLILFFNTINTFAQDTPPSAPLTPKEWVKNMSYGSWWLFTIPPDGDNNITIDGYSTRILDSLMTLGINGGRLHWVTRDALIYDEITGDTILDPDAVAFVGQMIDDFTSRGMSICLQVSFEDKGVKTMPEYVKQRHFNGWRQLSEAYKNKSYLLAMCPVIEFHGWQYYIDEDGVLQPNDPEIYRDSLNWLYDSLTVIFREDNPYRIMSYKPWGSSKRGEVETLAFPFGNDPSAHSGKPYYYIASMSGSYGMGEWFKWSPGMHPDTLKMIKEQTMRAGLTDITKDVGIHHAINFRDTSGIDFWIDHWDPAFWKHLNDGDSARWSIEQNLAYIEFFMDTLKSLGVAGAGMQTRRFWNDKTDTWIEIGDDADDGADGYLEADTMSVKMIELLRNKAGNETYMVKVFDSPDIKIYPNPASSFIQIEKPENLTAELYSVTGSKITDIKNGVLELNFPRGTYLIVFRNKNNKVISTKKIIIQ